MDFEQLINNMTPEIHAGLKRAVEIGKWPAGTRLTQEHLAAWVRWRRQMGHNVRPLQQRCRRRVRA